jgi:6-phosphogluconolactonase
VADIVVVDGPKQAAHEVARLIAADIERVVAAREWCWIALSGGHFAAPIYEDLAKYAVPWSQVEFFFTDERCVPPSHPSSSYGEAVDRLFTNPRIEGHQVHRIEAERPEREAVLEEYERELPEQFDIVLLELGLDGHVASLFPNSPALGETERRIALVECEQKPRWRMTLAPSVLAGAERTYVVGCGRERAPIVQRALSEDTDPRDVPARVCADGVWILDRAAASSLEGCHER